MIKILRSIPSLSLLAVLLFATCGKKGNPAGLDSEDIDGIWRSEDGSLTLGIRDTTWWSGLNEGALIIDGNTGTLGLLGQDLATIERKGDQLQITLLPTGEVFLLDKQDGVSYNLDSASSITRRGNYIAFSSDRGGHPEGDVFIYTVNENAYLDTLFYYDLQIVETRTVTYDTNGNVIDSTVTVIRDTTLERKWVEPIRALTDRTGADVMPAWSPDGMRLAFVSDQGGYPAVWVYYLDLFGNPVDTLDQNPVQLTDAGGDLGDANPTWSPDGEYIAFERKGPGAPDSIRDVYIISSLGEGEWSLNLTNTTDNDCFNPEWSPRGDLNVVLFETRPNGNSEDWDVYWMYANDTSGFKSDQKITNPNRNGHPTWSPDGRWVAYERNPPGNDGQYDIQIQTLAQDSLTGEGTTTRLTNQTDLPGLNRYPSWLPNGNLIAFMRANDIWLIDISAGVDAPAFRRLLEDDFNNWDIAW